jgi:conjugal transfer pilus assembly protein TraL
MSNKRGLYLVPKTLDAQVRLLGLPLDEFVPAVFLAGLFFLLGKVLLSIALPVLAIVLMKTMKQGQGSSWLINLCHWHLPQNVMMGLVRKTPPSQNREYIS